MDWEFVGFNWMNALFPVAFVTVFGIIVAAFIQGIAEWHRNNRSPRLTVWALAVAKRENVRHHRHANAGDITGAHGFHATASTTYYVTFEVESGDRMELCVDGAVYGMIAQGDAGSLTFQGTRFLDFTRE